MSRFTFGWVLALNLLLLISCGPHSPSLPLHQNLEPTAAPIPTAPPIQSTPSFTPSTTPTPLPLITPSQTAVYQKTQLTSPTVLAYPPATVNQPILDVWDSPAHEGSLIYRQTQLILGEKILLLQTQGDWAEIRAVEQPSSKDKLGYPGWVRRQGLAVGWSSSSQWVVVMEPQVEIMSAPDDASNIILRVFFDTRLPIISQDFEWIAVRLPDGRKGWVRSDRIRETSDLKKPYRLETLLNTARTLAGSPYLWGGTASPAFDCSGFIFRLYHAHGINLARDSQDQAVLGRQVDKSELKPGDLLFYSSRPDRQVTHVALYTGDGRVFDAAFNLGLTERPLYTLLDTRVLIQIVRVIDE